jgi:hypothetical protein
MVASLGPKQVTQRYYVPRGNAVAMRAWIHYCTTLEALGRADRSLLVFVNLGILGDCGPSSCVFSDLIEPDVISHLNGELR